MRFSIAVVITTYNSPLWLERVLCGYEQQIDKDFSVIVADDGSTETTLAVIEQCRQRKILNLHHLWHEDQGFRKTEILNKAIAGTDADYLIFTDGDCIPRSDFIAAHRANARSGYFLSGGYLKLSMAASESITNKDIEQQHPFDRQWLVNHGQASNHKLFKLVKSPRLAAWLNRVTPTRATWNGMNSSTWRADLIAVNGFDERMQYGGLDRELGERLWNHGLKSKQIRYTAICVHLDHARGYSKPEIWAFNNALRQEVKSTGRDWTSFGILKQERPDID